MQSRDIPNYLTQSILVTIFCCLPFGIAAIVQSAQVNSKVKAGDYEGAIQSSESAKKYCWYGFIGGIIVLAIYFVIGLASGG